MTEIEESTYVDHIYECPICGSKLVCFDMEAKFAVGTGYCIGNFQDHVWNKSDFENLEKRVKYYKDKAHPIWKMELIVTEPGELYKLNEDEEIVSVLPERCM